MSAVETALQGLRQMIASGELSPGQQFPPEAQLCERLEVSRGSLREAVRMLGALGVIEARHGSGTYVSALEPAQIIGSLKLTVGLMPFEGVLQMYELRRVLEAHAASQAAARMTDEVAAELVDLCARMEAAPTTTEASDLDAVFHDTIATLSGNEALIHLLRVFRSRTRAYQLFDLPAGRDMQASSDTAHRRIAAALVDRDPAAAALAAGDHVRQTEEWLRTHRPPAADLLE